jgi:RNA polymerase sigma-70 factor (ECF subfamily)
MRAGRDSDPALTAAAMQSLCESYWLPLYSYVRHRGFSAEDAQDITQDFFARLLEKNTVAKAQQSRGKFRSFLLGSLKNFLSDEWDKSRAQKRGGGVVPCSLEFADGERTYKLEPASNVTPEQIFERRWALTLLEKVLQRLQQEYQSAGKGDVFASLSPCLAGERTALPYAELAERMGITESAVKSMVHRLRGRYRTLLRLEIGDTVASVEEIDEELRYLFEVLSRR